MNKKPQTTTVTAQARPPVVAVLGHVDHGKTTLLDAIRKSKVAAGEHGGITQAIGGYQITIDTPEGKRKITFIDTPGHEAFTKMRSRGVAAADIAILVVAADDGVMPQTKEAIAHIKEARVPFIVALTKADLKTANPEKVKQQLIKEDIKLEGFGGETPLVSVSAKTGKGVKDLLELILLVAQMSGIKGDPSEAFLGVIIEAKRDRRKGVLATVIVRNGTLRIRDEIVAENAVGKVRALFTDTGASVKEALPGSPVEVLGFADVPPVGAKVIKKNEFTSDMSITEVKQLVTPLPQHEPSEKRLALILRSDTAGSLEAIRESLPKDDVVILLAATGEVATADVLLAKASQAIIVGFNTAIPSSVSKLAETEGVPIKNYKLIYELLSELNEVITHFKEGGEVAPKEIVLGKAKIVATFPFEDKKVAGCKVVEGRMAKGDKVRVERDGKALGDARIVSLRRGKEDSNKAEIPSECGILLSTPLDFEAGDVILSVR